MNFATAIQFDAAGHAQLMELEGPSAEPGSTEIAGTTLTSLVSPGTELAMANSGGDKPRPTGYAAVFQVEAVGNEVQGWQAGDLAFCMGPHRSFQQCPAAEAIKLPPGLTPELAPFCRLMGVSMSTLTTTSARPPQRVLISGLGVVGNLAAQVFTSCGYNVVACDPVKARQDLAVAAGIQHVAARAPLDDAGWRGQVALAIDCSGHEQAVLDACNMVQKGGEVVLIGVPWQRKSELFAHDILHAVFHRYVELRSGWEWQLPRQPQEFVHNSIRENLQGALRWLADGRVQTNGLHNTRRPEDCGAAYGELLGGHCTHLTTLFDWRKKN